ncbi:DUF4280 domain-containing protein [Salmonella enterica]|nr:DUF4280 domain-containing protein [Salmonella enterica]EBM0756960.1 DUF4280 domain-containing protein [Salmonella enterica subsp. enterica serovar Muenchen]EBZ4664587.1 DUF4280 domain-containing protein [Salmonella enterica subsp. enterica serovar Bovismorbificans]ECH8729569.1 DUF4280 domain-containing protein [Salmonella enterica subsp. enterica]ECH8734422.1 DUF4280 domain-containing protein [Salmonella enterica subsp. enterica serovar Wandsworth]EGI6306953.1 DUF4280 domain-containing prot
MSCPAVCAGAVLECEGGVAPSGLMVLPEQRVFTGGRPVASIMAHLPEVNISSFGLCHSPRNPEFIAATAAAFGVPTPVPCIPVTPVPWIPEKPNVLIGMTPILTRSAKLECLWGTISIVEPGQFTVVC